MPEEKEHPVEAVRQDGRINLRGLSQEQLAGLRMLQSQFHTKSLNQTVLLLIDQALLSDAKHKEDFYFAAYLESEKRLNARLENELKVQQEFRRLMAEGNEQLAKKFSYFMELTGRVEPEEDK